MEKGLDRGRAPSAETVGQENSRGLLEDRKMSTKLESTSPVSGEVVWTGFATTADEVANSMCIASAAQVSWSREPIERRIEIIRRYGQYLQENRHALAQLLTDEVGKLPWDAQGEVNAAIAKVELSIEAFQQRRAPHVVGESMDSVLPDQPEIQVVRRVRQQPLGVVLVLGPFNFPLHLPGGQIIPASLRATPWSSSQATRPPQSRCGWGRHGVRQDYPRGRCR